MTNKNEKKYLYKIIFGELQQDYQKKYTYNYYSSQIDIEVSQGYGRISFYKHKKEKEEKFLRGYFFSESIKRLFFVYLLNYSSLLEYETCTVYIDETIFPEVIVPVASLFQNNEFTQIPDTFKSDQLINELIQDFTQNNAKIVSINNYLLALSYSNSPIEQFMHLWMSFNGLYGFFKNKIQSQLRRTGYVSENKELKWWGIGFNLLLQDNLFSQDRDLHVRNAKEIIDIITEATDFEDIHNLNTLYNSSVNQIIITEVHSRYGVTIDNGFAYILLKIAYYKRCDLFHGAKKIILFSSKPQSRHKLYKFLNELLIDYISQIFVQAFDDSNLHTIIARKQNSFH